MRGRRPEATMAGMRRLMADAASRPAAPPARHRAGCRGVSSALGGPRAPPGIPPAPSPAPAPLPAPARRGAHPSSPRGCRARKEGGESAPAAYSRARQDPRGLPAARLIQIPTGTARGGPASREASGSARQGGAVRTPRPLAPWVRVPVLRVCVSRVSGSFCPHRKLGKKILQPELDVENRH